MKQKEIELDAVNFRCDTALILAAAGRHRAVVKLLLEAGADTRPVDRLNYTALKAAIKAKDAAIVELILNKSEETTDFHAFGHPMDVFGIAVTDLAPNRCDAVPDFAVPGGDPLQLFAELSRQIPSGGDTLPLVQWLRARGFLMVCAQEVAAMLAPAHAWASKACGGRRESIEHQRLVYSLSAVGQLASGACLDKVSNIYRQAGVSERRVGILGGIAGKQLSELAEAAGNAAAQLGGKLVEKLIARCLAQTTVKYEVHPDDLRNRLVQEGFIEPLANVIASGWQSALAAVRSNSALTPAGLTLVDTIEYVYNLVNENVQRALPQALNDKLRTQTFLHTLGPLLPARHEEVVHELFQTQCSWLAQFHQHSRST